MERGICGTCDGPVTNTVELGWVHDEGRVWPDNHDHAPQPRQVAAA